MARLFLAALAAIVIFFGGCSQFPLPPTLPHEGEGLFVTVTFQQGKVAFGVGLGAEFPIRLTITGPGPGVWWKVGEGEGAPTLIDSGYNPDTGYPRSVWELTERDSFLFIDGDIEEPRGQFSSAAFTAVDAKGNELEVLLRAF